VDELQAVCQADLVYPHGTFIWLRVHIITVLYLTVLVSFLGIHNAHLSGQELAPSLVK